LPGPPVSSGGNVMALFDAFLKIKGIEGESTDKVFKGQI
jgi:hypothetical protein